MSAVPSGDDYNPCECPITEEPMTNPVLTPCGHTFEKVNIVAWIAKNSTCPTCRTVISSDQLIPNRALADAIARLPKKILEDLNSSQESPKAEGDKGGVAMQEALRAAQEDAAAARAQMRTMEQKIQHQNALSSSPLCAGDVDDEPNRLMAENETLALVLERLEQEQEARAAAEAAKQRAEQEAKAAKRELEASQRVSP